MLGGLAEAQPRVDKQVLHLDPVLHRPRDALGKEGVDLRHDVLVDGRRLHGLGLAQHVHEDHRAVRVADDGHHLGIHA